MTLLALAIVAGTGNIYAQYASDALRFSQTNYGSSSRFKGLGNAQISLGGDISSLGGNPAGLGMFTRSEFSLTPEFNNAQNKASFLGENSDASKNRLNLNQAGVVWYNPVIKKPGSDLNKGLLSVVWGIGYNRNNDFSNQVNYAGTNPNNSVADFFAEEASNSGYFPDDDYTKGTLSDMAFKQYLITQTGAGATTYYPSTNVNNRQSNHLVRTGSTSELNFSSGLNFSNQFYIGASIGIVNVRYNNESEYNESGTMTVDPENDQSGRNYNLSYRQSQVTDGTGINARLGMIFKPVNAVRIGATFQTPTWMHIEDNFGEILDTRYTAPGITDNFSADQYSEYNFQYSLRTPYKGSLGASVIIGNNALLSADVDYVDYASMKLSTTSGFDGSDDRTAIRNNNLDIKDLYTGAMNYRVGGEYKIGQLSLRAGYGLNGSPYKDDDDNVFDSKYYSGGLGYRFSQFYFDLAYQRMETNNTYSPYVLSSDSPTPEPVADVKLTRNNVFLTFGVKF